jgi:cytosine/adenosine deaminase-related metal-dependent hydrolase
MPAAADTTGIAMDFDLVLRDVRLPGGKPDQPTTDIAVKGGRIVGIAPKVSGSAKDEMQGHGRLVCAGFVETHIHLDKSCILARCACETKRFPHLAMERVSAVKHTFTVEDVTERAAGTIENASRTAAPGCALTSRSIRGRAARPRRRQGSDRSLLLGHRPGDLRDAAGRLDQQSRHR